MPSLKEYNVKLQRLSNTRKLTRTMKMVSANKLRKAQDVMARAANFENQMARAAALAAGTPVQHPLAQARPREEKIVVLLITSDKGMCGGFNNNLSKRVLSWMESATDTHREITVCACGKRGALYFKNKEAALRQYDDIITRLRPSLVRKVASDMQDLFLEGVADAIYLGFNKFRSALTQTPVIERLLPLELPSMNAGRSAAGFMDPSRDDLLDHVLPQLVFARIFTAMAGSIAGEHGARMTAMDNASTNCDKLIGNYTLLRNRARQAAITRELIEIVAGAEALK